MFIFPIYILTHPFKGFEELKVEKKGKTYVAVIYVILTILALIYAQTSAGFLINPFPDSQVNILTSTLVVLLPILLAAVGNWSVTSLLDGKGKSSRDINDYLLWVNSICLV